MALHTGSSLGTIKQSDDVRLGNLTQDRKGCSLNGDQIFVALLIFFHRRTRLHSNRNVTNPKIIVPLRQNNSIYKNKNNSHFVKDNLEETALNGEQTYKGSLALVKVKC